MRGKITSIAWLKKAIEDLKSVTVKIPMVEKLIDEFEASVKEKLAELRRKTGG